jgi:6-phosphofructokinase 2
VTTTTHRIVTLTMSPSLDMNATVDRVLPEKKLRCSRPSFEAGGGGINVSRALHQLGGDSLAVFPAGGDAGNHIKRLLAAEGVTYRAIPVQAATRINLSVESLRTQEDFRFVMPGAELSDSEARACLSEVGALSPDPEWLIASGSLPPGAPADFYGRLAVEARRRGIRLVLDAEGPSLEPALEVGVFMIKPNLGELHALAGRRLDDHDQESFVRELIERGRCESALVSLGAAGGLFVTKEGSIRLRSPTVPIRSRVGAGDSTVAALVLAHSRGLPAREAAIFAVAAGAAAVMAPGRELCGREDTERLYQMMRSDPAYAT